MSQPTTPRTRKAPAAARKPSGKVRTGNPVEDRAVRAAAADKKAASKATPAKATPAKRAAAKAAPAKAVAMVTFTPAIKAKHLTAAPVSLPKGYFIKWDNGAYLLAKPGEGAAAGGPAWFVICTEHGTTTQATSARDGDHLGRKADRGTWCKKCQG